MTGARSIALEVIRRVVDEGAYSNRLLPTALARSGLDVRDRAFAMELAYGTLRHRLRLDDAIASAARRDVGRITSPAIHVLRLGAYQLLVAGVAPHAAVGESVALAGPRERGFVNAVLRRLAAAPPPVPGGDSAPALAARTGMSAWAVRELRALLGEDAERAASAFAERGPLTLRVRGDRATLRRALADGGVDASDAPLDEVSLLVDGGDPSTFPGYAEGSFAIQDQASTVVVRILDPRPGDRVADLCAAPGGKATFAADLVGAEGSIVAADVHERRVRLIRREAARLRLDLDLVVQDATASALRGRFDRVLVDAPCSGLGSARRRPELLWRVDATRVPTLAARQLAILASASELVPVGGRLVYAVCTFPRAETDGVADVFLRTHRAFEPVETPGPDGQAVRHRI
ncbi:MAG TPA: transcription antitermination factor NusB, partial [Actinomycetota bacterium]